jgi:hypothetical protein
MGVNGGQLVSTAHFDNSNLGPMQYRNLSTGIDEGGALHNPKDFLLISVANLDNWRAGYTNASSGNISKVFSSFGHNSHAIADFYTHSNWVDGVEREGCYTTARTTGRVVESVGAWISNGLNHYQLCVWGGAVAVDQVRLQSLPSQLQKRYLVEETPGGYAVVEAAIKIKHDLAFHLAVLHTVKEIGLLEKNAATLSLALPSGSSMRLKGLMPPKHCLRSLIAATVVATVPGVAQAAGFQNMKTYFLLTAICVGLNLMTLLVHGVLWKKGARPYVWLAVVSFVLSSLGFLSAGLLLLVMVSGPLTVLSMALSGYFFVRFWLRK